MAPWSARARAPSGQTRHERPAPRRRAARTGAPAAERPVRDGSRRAGPRRGRPRRAGLSRRSALQLALPEAGPPLRGDDQPGAGPARTPVRAPRDPLARAGGAPRVRGRNGQVPLLPPRWRHRGVGLHPRAAPAHDLPLDAGGLPAQVRVLPHGRGRLPAQPVDGGDPGPGGGGDGGRAAAGAALERGDDGDGGAAAQLRGHARGAARPDGPGRLRGRPQEADALNGGHPARSRDADAGAVAAEPGDQSARPERGAAPRADADRVPLSARGRDRGSAALSAAQGRPCHLRVRAAARRERFDFARPPAGAAAARGALHGESAPVEPRSRAAVRAAERRGGRLVLRGARREPAQRLGAPPARPRHPRGLRAAPPQAGVRAGARARRALSRFAAGAAALLAGSALLLTARLGSAPLERAEIYFMDGARSLVERGDWLVPYYRGEPFFDKPALTYWLMAGAFRGLGFTLGAARLVPALAALGALAATLRLGTRLLDERAALTGGLLLATTLAFLSFGRVAMSDMLLTLWTTLAYLLSVRLLQPSPPPWILPALGATLGLGFLTKGPIALLLPGLGIVPLARSLRGRPPIGRARAALALALFVAFGLGWFLALGWRLGWDPLAYFFLRENLQRFAGQTYDMGREWWFYGPAYLAVGMPWSLFLPVALSCYLREDLAGAPGLASSRQLAAWAGLMLVPLSLSRGKLDYYLLPLLPALSLVLGHYFAQVPWGRFERVWARSVLAASAAALLVVAAAPFHLPLGWLPGSAGRWLLTLVASGGALACALAVVHLRPARAVAALSGSTAAVFLVLVLLFLPAFRTGQPNAAVLEDVLREQRYRPDLRVVVCEDPARVQRDLLFHARIAVDERCDLWNPAASQLPFLLLLSGEEHASLDAALKRLRLVNRYDYLPAQVLSLKGLLRLSQPEPLFLAANFPTQDPLGRERWRLERRVERERGAGPRQRPRP